jgi:D-glycero-D-manno-heptose 1,7-bisphosphate phosphatase
VERAVFLDRDGTIIEDVGYLDDCSRMKFLPGAVESIRLLNKSGYKVIIVTNQAGIARGYFSEEKLKEINARMLEKMAGQGAHIDKIYYCPHHIEGSIEEYKKECSWRKPNPGMLEAAAREYDLDIANSFMIGDKINDIEAGHRAGCRTILLTGQEWPDARDDAPKADKIADSLYDAVLWIRKSDTG